MSIRMNQRRAPSQVVEPPLSSDDIISGCVLSKACVCVCVCSSCTCSVRVSASIEGGCPVWFRTCENSDLTAPPTTTRPTSVRPRPHAHASPSDCNQSIKLYPCSTFGAVSVPQMWTTVTGSCLSVGFSSDPEEPEGSDRLRI